MAKKERTPAQTVIEDVTGVKKNEKVLIIANPETNIIAQDLFTAALEAGAKPSLIYQQKKSGMESAEDTVIGAIKSEPDVVFSISAVKLGKDTEAIAKPYISENGAKFDHIFDYLLDGKKSIRAVWTPGLTEDMFNRTVMIDYRELRERCSIICGKYENAVSVHVTSPNGTDIVVPVAGRKPLEDNGDFSKPGLGGNIPAGEVFISPVVGTGNQGGKVEEAVKKGLKGAIGMFRNASKNAAKIAEKVMPDGESGESKAAADEAEKSVQDAVQSKAEMEAAVQQTETKPVDEINAKGASGRIVFDGSMTVSDQDLLLKTPITADVVDGFVTDITGGEEAKKLLHDIMAAERESYAMEVDGRLPAGQGFVYARNARNIGELGIGLNPAANITGNMLEDEKAFRTCHFAIGMNYDGDAPCLIHFDGVVRNPTIVIKYADGSEFKLLDRGDLQI